MLPTKTAATLAAYIKRAESMVKRAALELGASDPQAISPSDLAGWAINQRLRIRPTSWRLYRSALICYLEQRQLVDGGQYPDIQSAVTLLKNSDGIPCQRGKSAPIRTSAGKKRSLSNVELVAMLDYFQNNKTRWSVAASIWLRAAVITGLRPSEWKTARLDVSDCDNPILIVQNAKCTNGRAHGVNRTLHLCHVSQGDLKAIDAQLKAVQIVLNQAIFDWDDYYNGVRKAIHKATRALWPKRAQYPSLYSGRHQFSADAKKAGLTKAEVAALMGHGSELTAGKHYGKKRSGKGGFAIEPDASDVKRIGLSMGGFKFQAPKARHDTA